VKIDIEEGDIYGDINEMKEYFSCINAENVKEFLELINKRDSKWRDNPSKVNYWIYRGQWEKESLNLLSKSLRQNLGLKADSRIKNEILKEKLLLQIICLYSVLFHALLSINEIKFFLLCAYGYHSAI